MGTKNKKGANKTPKSRKYLPYKVTEHSRKRATKLGLTVERSRNRKKKLDVFRDGKKIATIGDARYLDFPTRLEMAKKNQEVSCDNLKKFSTE